MVEITGYNTCGCGEKEKHWELDLHPPVHLSEAADLMEKFVEEEFSRHCKYPLVIVYGGGKGKVRAEVVTFLKQSNMTRSHIGKFIEFEDVFVVIDKERIKHSEEQVFERQERQYEKLKKQIREEAEARKKEIERRWKKARNEGYGGEKDLENIIKWEKMSNKEKKNLKFKGELERNMKNLEPWKEGLN